MSIYREAGDMYGDGLWDDIKSGARRAFKAVQSSDTVRNLEKGLVQKGADVLGHRCWNPAPPLCGV